MNTAGSGGLCYLAGQVVNEYDLFQSSPTTSKRPLEEALTALRKGTLLLKHGRHGKPKVHFFRVTGCDTLLKWRSASGSVKQVRLHSVKAVVLGQTTEVFKRHPLREPAYSFSLQYDDDDGSRRTLDLTCADEQQLDLWYTGLRVVVDRLRSTHRGPGTPQPAAAGSSSGAGGLSPAHLARCLAEHTLQRQGSGPFSMPAAERTPCDLLAWGSAQRAPPAAVSMRSVMGVVDDCWQHRSLPGLAPGGLQLDAYRAAVGRKHAAVITATGALYTWGEGRGGKLGLGHDQDQAAPQRLRHGLEGQCIVAVACGDDCTAALTDSGELYMWGRLHADARPQLVPLHVRGDLKGRKVVQISCGPFHCAAVSSDGQLFTWGEGFGGKLGHGDQSNRTHPALVQAFVGRQVLEVACGVWHTAAIVADAEGSPYSLPHSPAKVEGCGPVDLLPGSVSAEAVGPPASPILGPGPGPAHHRNNSTSSAFSEASVFHDGQGGSLYTWGGVNESVAFGNSEKRDSNKGCLGHGEADLYRGQLLPVRVGGALEHRQVRHVAAGSHLTVAVTTGGRVFQMGVTGASAPKNCPWEGATLPELVRGMLTGVFVDEVSCGMHHVVVTGRPLDRRQGRPADHAPRAIFAWGRGSEGQLGVRSFDDSAAPAMVESLKGRQVLQVTCGGSNTMAVCEHDVRRFEPDSREEADATSRVLYALMSDSKGTPGGKQLRIQAPGDISLQTASRESSGSGMGLVRRSFSMLAGRTSGSGGGGGSVAGGSAALVPYGAGPPDLSRFSSGSVRSIGAGSAAGSGRAQPQSFSQLYSTLRTAQRSQKAQQRNRPAANGSLPTLAIEGSAAGGSTGGWGGSSGTNGVGRVVSIGSPMRSAHSHTVGSSAFGRRSTYAGAGSTGMGGMTSARSFTMSGARSFGGRSDMSSLSSWQHRPQSEDGGPEHEGDGSGGAFAANGHRTLSADTTVLDEMRTSSSLAALQDELAEKNRTIERLQRKLEKMQQQRQQQQQQQGAPTPTARAAANASAERLKESVLLSAGAFREAQLSGSPQRPQTSPGATSPGQSSLPSPGGDPQERQAQLQAMEQMLAKKQVHLEGRQKELAAWAEELRRREEQLNAQQARMEGRPPPAPAAAPATAPAAAAAAVAQAGSAAMTPPVRRVVGEAAAAAALASGPGSTNGSVGSGPTTPQAPGEWTEEFEEGVFLTYATEGGAKKLRRIRFNRSLFSADSAKQWYEVNKHRLAQHTGTPQVSGAAGSTAAGSLPASPSALAEQQQQQQADGAGEEGRQQQGAAAPLAPAAGAAAAAVAASGQLHYRQTSRNLSFDARELASFHERLQQVAAAGQQAGPAGSAAAAQHHRPSRLSRLAHTAGGGGGGSGVEAGGAGGGAGGGAAASVSSASTSPIPELPESPFASASASPLCPAWNEEQQQQHGAGSNMTSPLREGTLSRGFESAQSSPRSSSPAPHSRHASLLLPGELATMHSSAAAYDGGSAASSPIRASGGSRSSGSPLSKQRSAASSSLTKQLSSAKSDAAGKMLFTPRAQLEKQHSVASAAAGCGGSGTAPGSSGKLSLPAGSPSAASPTAFATPGSVGSVGDGADSGIDPREGSVEAQSGPGGRQVGLSGTMSRLRRSLTGGKKGGR